MTPDQDTTIAPAALALSRPIGEWFPSDEVRTACMSCLADSITRAHALGAARWVLTLSSGSVLTLSVGQLLVLRFQDNGEAKIALVETALDAPAAEFFADITERTTVEPFAIAPEVVVRSMPADALSHLLPRLRPALEAAIDRAAKTVSSRTGYYTYFSTEAVALVEAETGRTLPRPDYQLASEASPLALSPTRDEGSDRLWSDAELREAWRTFDAETAPWIADGARLVVEIAEANAASFGARATQQRLWSGKGVASAGMGEAINVTAAFDDPEVLARLDGLRRREWPTEVEECARAMQAEFDAVMVRLISGLGVRAQPTAKLLRTFAILVPAHLTCLLQSDARARAVRRILGRPPTGSAITEQVRMRARLRSVLGEEATLTEHVRRSRFAWRIQAQAPPVLASVGPQPAPTTPAPTPPAEPPEAPRLELWPIGRQYRGVGAIGGYAGTWRDILRAALPGQTVDVLVDEVRAAGLSASAKTIAYAISRLYGMELLVREGGVYRPSPEGLQILDGDDGPLVERLLVSTYGFAQLLRCLVGLPGGLPKRDLFARIRQHYPAWTSDFAPVVLVAFFVDLGLVEALADDKLRLTEYGAQWHARLPEVLPDPVVAPAPGSIGPSSSTEPPSPVEVLPPSFIALATAFRDNAETRGFVIDDATLRALHVAWTCHPSKHFILLSGLSGTGKTAVLRHYARTWCRARGLDSDRHLAVVAVSPDWHDPSGLLGYFNPLHEDPTYQIEPALQLLLAADADRANPYFLVLDEMNLARVERYLAPLLSAMETGDPIALHASTEAVNGVPPSIAWPRNLFLAGTVNMDESTHPFSDKVLDRAFTLEFWDVDLKGFFERRPQRHAATEACLIALHDALRPARRHFGYRTAGEVVDFTLGSLHAGESESAAIDMAVFSKVLPRLRGDQDPDLQRALKAASEITAQQGLTRSSEKLRVMQQRLQATGVTRFWS